MNIELKPWTMDDLHDLVRLCNAADRTYLSGRMPFPYTESDARWWLNMVKEKEGKDGVFRRICVEGKTAGNISVERKDAVRMITAEAMETLALARISAQVYSPNIASRRVLEHNGFQQEGLLPQAVWKDGMTYDLILYGILRDPWKKD